MLGEADTGPSGTTAAQGYYFVTEIGYNPLSNSLGVSTSQAQATSLNVPSLTPAASRLIVTRGDQSLGFAGVEAIGQVNALVNFADPRAEQYGEVIAYPFNIFTPWDPITCTQVLVTGVASTGLNLFKTNSTNGTIALPSDRLSSANGGGGPAQGLTQVPVGLAPFCLQWFDLQTLDAYHSFRDQLRQAYNNDYFDNGYGYSDYGSPRDTAPPVGQQRAGSIPRPAGDKPGGGGGPAGGDAATTPKGAGAPTGGRAQQQEGLDAQGLRGPSQQRPGQAEGSEPEPSGPMVRFIGEDTQDDAATDSAPQASSVTDGPKRPSVEQLLLSGASSRRPLVNMTRAALAESPAGKDVQKAVTNRISAAMKTRQVAAEAAALRAEAVLRVIVRVAGSASPLTAALLDMNQDLYKGAAKLSNAAVDAAIRRLEAGLPPQVLQTLRQRADEMAAQISANLSSVAEQADPPGAGGSAGLRGL